VIFSRLFIPSRKRIDRPRKQLNLGFILNYNHRSASAIETKKEKREDSSE